MASSTDAENSSTVAEESDHTHVCSPCDADGQKLKAVGYCVNCTEYLCRRCYDVHLLPSVTRKHKLLDENDMPEIRTKNNSMCTEHNDRQIEYHCATHSFFGCHLCCFKHQKSCKDVQFIPEISETVTDSEEFTLFNERLTCILTKCINMPTEFKEKTEATATWHTKTVTAIKTFKKDVIDAVEKKEQELLEKADTLKKEAMTSMTNASDKCKEIHQEVQTIASTVELLQNKQQKRDLYMTIFQSKDNLFSLENDLQAAVTNTYNRRFAFSTNNDLLEMLKNPLSLGLLHHTDTLTEVKHVQDIDIDWYDLYGCRLVCSVFISDQKLVIADAENNKLKLLDTKQSKLMSQLTMKSSPWGVCRVTGEQVAVTLPSEKKIALVRTSPSLSVDRTIAVDGICRGVGYCDRKLVVSFDSNKVEVLDIQGTVLKKIETDDSGEVMFNDPHQLTVNPERRLIYVSNNNSSDVVCMTFDGTVVARYEDKELKGPWQIVFPRRGAAFVCGQGSNNIHQITEDCQKVKVLLTKVDGLAAPQSVSYCGREDKLYIGQHSNDYLKVFKVSHATQ